MPGQGAPMRDKDQVAENVSYLIERSGMSVPTIASLTQTDSRTIRNWMVGETTPDVVQAKRLCKAIGCTLNEIGAGV